MQKTDKIIILDFGSQVTQLIARRIRSKGILAEIVPFNISARKLQSPEIKGIIFSGGPASVYAKNSPHPDKGIFYLGKPILGICYGLQLLAHHLGGKVEKGTKREYGKALLKVGADTIHPLQKVGLFIGTTKTQTVWMSHGDVVSKIPKNFITIARTSHSPHAAIAHFEKKFFGVQFHPEVSHTDFGAQILDNFTFKICKARRQWDMKHFISFAIKDIKKAAGKQKVIHALSGGVDSTVLALLLKKALPQQQIKNIFIDNGLLRKNEAAEVRKYLKKMGLKVNFIDASQKFLRGLKGVVEPEQKRKIIGRIFIEVLMSQVSKNSFLSQGTLYPDVIESIKVHGPSDTIKTHHNRAPEVLELIRQGRIIEPLKELFKDEVREVGFELGVPKEILWRHPFPGPGLAVSILGEVTPERLEILRQADVIYQEEIKKAGLYGKITQAFSALDTSRAVGVKGDEREYGYMILLRAITTLDFMTADWYPFSHEFLARVSGRIINEVGGVTRVLYDITQKPPGTITFM